MLLLSTASLKGYGIHKIFEIIKKAEYDGIDLELDEKNFDTLDGEYLKSLSDAFELPILSITTQEKISKNININKIEELARILNVQVVNFFPIHYSEKNGKSLPEILNKIKKNLHISITVQNIEQRFFLLIIPEYKNANLLDIKKVTGDSALNISAIIDKDLLGAQLKLGNTIKNIYLNDKNGTKTFLLPGTAGGGMSYMPVEQLLMKLKGIGYNGFFTLKVKPSELGVGNEDKIYYNLKTCKEHFMKYFTNHKS